MLPLPSEINVFTVQDPSKNDAKSLQKKTLQPDPPKSSIFNLRAVSNAPGPPQKEPFWKPFRLMLSSRGALRFKVEDFEGGLVAEFFLKRFCTIFGGVLDSENVDFAWEG